MIGVLLTRWTIRLALLCYAVVLAAQLSRSEWASRRGARWCWTAGCLLLWGHIAAAFHFYHDWRHTLAFQETARRTEELLGWAFGGGIYFNHVFAALWGIDAAWWWLAPQHYAHRPRGLTLPIQAYLLFIIFNGAIVFESGPTRWVGLALLPILLGLAAVGLRRRIAPSNG